MLIIFAKAHDFAMAWAICIQVQAMYKFLRLFSLVSLLLCSPGLASAAEDSPSQASTMRSSAVLRRVSLTTDPTRALMGMGLLNGEVGFPNAHLFPNTIGRDVSLAGWVAAGQMRRPDVGGPSFVWNDCNETFYCDRATVVWAGAQALLYPLGTFEHGLQVGIEASFVGAWGKRHYTSLVVADGQSDVTRVARPSIRHSETGFLPGVVIGYKLVTKAGFTFNPQFATDYIVSAGALKTTPRLALNAGWSF